MDRQRRRLGLLGPGRSAGGDIALDLEYPIEYDVDDGRVYQEISGG